MKVIARQANDAERADLDALLAREPELRAEFTRLEADARVAKVALPLVAACTSSNWPVSRLCARAVANDGAADARSP
jgi:hypothetical protein